MKILKLLLAALAATLLLAGCLVVVDEARYDVTYRATKEFPSDEATLRYTTSSGSQTTASFSGSDLTFQATATVNSSVPVTFSASDVFGQVTIGMTVTQRSDNSVVFQQEKLCTNASACSLSYSSP